METPMRHSLIDGSSSKFSNLFRSDRFAAKTLRGSLVAAAALLPLHGFSDSSVSQYEKILSKKTLTVVGVAGNTTFFQEDEFLHGFGYDLAREYARDLQVEFKFKAAKNNAAALDMVKNGQADFALTTADIEKIEAKSLTALDVSCGNQKALQKNGLNTKISWTFRDAADPLAATANGFICNNNQKGTLDKLAAFYNRNVMDDYAKQVFKKDITARLPVYKASFKQTAKQNDVDWHLLAAIGYQESYLKPTSVSPTGVTGLMMLTQNTAKAMGVSDRRDPTQSIQGGAKYFRMMLTQFKDVPNPDQVWFALAAYNMGPGALNSVRAKVKRNGKNPDSWVDVYQYLSSNAKSNSRYTQCIHYVTRIRAYLENIKQDQNLATI
jgi:membrane-bound lytic murein transglycosylase MltF